MKPTKKQLRWQAEKCESCGKSGFKRPQGLRAHERSHRLGGIRGSKYAAKKETDSIGRVTESRDFVLQLLREERDAIEAAVWEMIRTTNPELAARRDSVTQALQEFEP